MGLTALDTSVVVGLLAIDDALHIVARGAVLSAMDEGDRLGVPLVAWSELIAGVRMGHGEESTLRAFRAEPDVELLALDETGAERAGELRAAGLRLRDALIFATVERAGARTVLTGDRRWSSVESPVAVVVLEAS